MNSHIEYIATNISGTKGVLCRIHLFACQSVLEIYNYHNSLINSYLQYGYIVWANNYLTRLDKLFKLQKKALLVITLV